MKSSNYNKVQGNRELRESLVLKKDFINYSDSSLKDLNIVDDYSKEDGGLDPSLFVIISGGQVREKDYFSTFMLRETKGGAFLFPRIKIDFISENKEGIGGFNVNQLVDRGIEIKTIYDESNSGELDDKIYLVTDVDHFKEELISRKPDCVENNLKLIISNPCIEIWLYYSYFKGKPLDFIVPEDVSKISSSLKEYNGEKKVGGIDPRKAPLLLSDAITNAKEVYSEDNNGIPKLFSTNMYELAEEILVRVDFEIDNEKLRREKKAEEYRKKAGI